MSFNIFANCPGDKTLVHTKSGKFYVYQDNLDWTVRQYDENQLEKPWKMKEVYRTDSAIGLCSYLDSLNGYQ